MPYKHNLTAPKPGGASKTEVVISDEKIDYPKVQRPDIFVALSQAGLDAYLHDLKEGGILIIDPDMIKEEELLPSWRNMT